MAFLKSALLVGVTAVLVVFLPRLFQTPLPILIDGFVAPGFEDVLDAFRENFETGLDSREGGSAFSVHHRGEKVVDIWGGYADSESHQKWRNDTLSIFFSSTKGISSVCIAMLVDRGLLDYNKPVADYWPEFAQKGKGEITVKQMMEHKAGLVLAAPPGLSRELLSDVAKAGELMASTEPMFKPDGHTRGYHAFTFGPLTNELLRRVDPQHRTLGQFFKEEIAEPFGIDFHIGLPIELNHRVARLRVDKRLPVLQALDVIGIPTSRELIWHTVKTNLYPYKVLENVNEMADINVFNNPSYRAIEIASANGYGTARDVAKLYSILSVGGTDAESNKTLLSKDRVEAFANFEPATKDFTLGIPTSFSHGMDMNNVFVDGVVFFGHPGAGGQYGAADRVNQVGFAFVSSHMTPHLSRDSPRIRKLIRTAYKCIARREQN